jgi:2-methylisocitrate lyase-like PEP mutase family enzyme
MIGGTIAQIEPRTTVSPPQVSHSAEVSALQSGHPTVPIAPFVTAAAIKRARMMTEAIARAIFFDFVIKISNLISFFNKKKNRRMPRLHNILV